jgi:hypothetical protein
MPITGHELTADHWAQGPVAQQLTRKSRGRTDMRRSMKGLRLPAVILAAGCLAAGCGSSASSAISNLTTRAASITATTADTTTPTPTDTSTPTPTVTITPTPTVTITPTPIPTVTNTTTITATATATATPPTPTPTATSASASPGAATSSSGTNLLWLWILLGALILGGLIAWIVSAARGRSATAADWQSRLIDAYARGSALHDAMSVAEAPGAIGSPDAAARWADIQRRADDLTQTLYRLREAVPDDSDSARIADTLASLQAVRSAMAAERAPGGAGPQQAEVVRGRLYSFELSLRALREGSQGYS